MQQTGFDIYAKTYDEHFTNSIIGKAQRYLVHSFLKRKANINENILEINCGTGEDALFFLNTCKSIACTDISEGMINETKEKLKHFSNAKALISSAQNIGKNVNGNFDLIFSNFGGLNCLNETELKEFFSALPQLTQKKSELVFVIMGRKCLWERIFFLLKFNKHKAFRRKSKNGVFADLGSVLQKTFYYSPKEIKKFLETNFEVLNCKPIGFFIPPSYFNPFFSKHKILFFTLYQLEKLTSSLNFLSNYADHYLIHLKRK